VPVRPNLKLRFTKSQKAISARRRATWRRPAAWLRGNWAGNWHCVALSTHRQCRLPTRLQNRGDRNVSRTGCPRYEHSTPVASFGDLSTDPQSFRNFADLPTSTHPTQPIWGYGDLRRLGLGGNRAASNAAPNTRRQSKKDGRVETWKDSRNCQPANQICYPVGTRFIASGSNSN